MMVFSMWLLSPT